MPTMRPTTVSGITSIVAEPVTVMVPLFSSQISSFLPLACSSFLTAANRAVSETFHPDVFMGCVGLRGRCRVLERVRISFYCLSRSSLEKTTNNKLPANRPTRHGPPWKTTAPNVERQENQPRQVEAHRRLGQSRQQGRRRRRVVGAQGSDCYAALQELRRGLQGQEKEEQLAVQVDEAGLGLRRQKGQEPLLAQVGPQEPVSEGEGGDQQAQAHSDQVREARGRVQREHQEESQTSYQVNENKASSLSSVESNQRCRCAVDRKSKNSRTEWPQLTPASCVDLFGCSHMRHGVRAR